MSGLVSSLFGSSPSVSFNSPYGGNISQLLSQLSGASNGAALQNAGTANLGTAANTATSLANGILPASYTNAEQQTLNNAVQQALGTGTANLAASGTLGGNSLTGLTNQIGQNAANTMAQDFTQNINTANGLNNSLANIGSTQSGIGLNQQSSLQDLLNALLGQNSTQVNPGSAGLVPSLLGGVASSGGLNSLFSGLFGL